MTFRHSNTVYRRWKSHAMLGLMALMVALCFIPLVSVCYALLAKGLPAMNWAFFTQRSLDDGKGGVAHAILGTCLLLVTAGVLAVPCGLLVGLFLAQRGQQRQAQITRLLLDVMSGIPAIMVGVFVYETVVRPRMFFGATFSLFAGGLALAIIMLPIFARTTEEAVKAVPRNVTEGGLALGIPRWKVILRIVLRGALPSVLTGLFLALARVGGEAAPLLYTSMGSNNWPSHTVRDIATLRPLTEQVASLPTQLFQFTVEGKETPAWGASLLLVVGILAVRISTKLYTQWRFQSGGKR